MREYCFPKSEKQEVVAISGDMGASAQIFITENQIKSHDETASRFEAYEKGVETMGKSR